MLMWLCVANEQAKYSRQKEKKKRLEQIPKHERESMRNHFTATIKGKEKKKSRIKQMQCSQRT